MLEMDIPPGGRGMTTRAVGAKLTVMRIVRGVTGKTIRWRTFVFSIGMAGGTGDAAMPPAQREARASMIEVNILPAP